MDGHEAIENRIAPGAETDSSVYVSSLQLTKGQPPPIAAGFREYEECLEYIRAIRATAYAHGSGRESLPPDVEVEVRAGERVECSPYVPDDGATT